MKYIFNTGSVIENVIDQQVLQIIQTLSDPEKFEQEWMDGDLEDDLFNILEQLESEIGYTKELEAIYDLCCNNEEFNDSVGQYVAFSNIHLRLIEKFPDEDIQKFLQPFINDPIDTIDHLMKLSNLFALFGRNSLNVKLTECVFERIAKSSQIFANADETLAKTIFCNEIQKIIISLQTEDKVSWNEFDKAVRPYGYNFLDSDYQNFENDLIGKIDVQKIRTQFKKRLSTALWDIELAFCSHMWNEKKLPVCTSEAIATLILNFLSSKTKSPNCSVEKFFKFSEAELDEHLKSLIGFFLPCIEDGIALLWGLPGFYKFLATLGLVDNETLSKAIETSDSFKNEISSTVPDSIKRYHFVESLS